LIVKCYIRWFNIKTFQLRTMFLTVLIHASRFLSFKLSSFFFFCLNYHSDFYSSLKSLYIHQMIKNHLIDNWNFLIYLPVYSYTSASVIIFIVHVYINLYLFLWFFFMSQRICTHCAHNHFIHEFLDSNSTHVLNLCSSLLHTCFIAHAN